MLAGAGLDARVRAEIVGNRLYLVALDAAVTALRLTSGFGDQAVRTLGFSPTESSQWLAGAATDGPVDGRLAADATSRSSLRANRLARSR